MTWIKDIANGLIETYETRNVYELVDALGITLIKTKLPKGKKGKFHRNEFGDEFIYIDQDLDEHGEKLTVAHELGHAILHTH